MTAAVLPARLASPDYAGVVSRTVAFFVDAIVVVVTTITVAAGAQLVVTVVGAEWRNLVHAALPALLAAVPLLFALYDFVFWVLAGRTPGMALLGLRLTSTAGSRAGWLSSLVRAVVLTVLPIGWLWC